MRLGKCERRALRELKRRKRVRGRGPIVGDQSTSVHVSMSNQVPSAGTSKVGAELFRLDNPKDKPTYTIDREPRLRTQPKHSGQTKRWSQG